MTAAGDFINKVPGFDFLQGLMQSAGSALPGMGSWVTPTLDPAALDKRIEELRTVQFWLEQNTKLIGASIQALEVQRMTLSTLKSMNLKVGELGEALKAKVPGAAPEASAEQTPPKPMVDPMQLWGALTKQFADIAVKAAAQVPKAAAAATASSATPAAKTRSRAPAKKAPARGRK